MNTIELEKIKQKALNEHIPIIMDDTLEVIAKILTEKRPKRILEIGAAVGYSAMCFSKYLAEDGLIDTIERDEERIEEAKQNFKKVEVENKINLYEGDAVEILPTLNEKYDVVFIDAQGCLFRGVDGRRRICCGKCCGHQPKGHKRRQQQCQHAMDLFHLAVSFIKSDFLQK